MDILNIFYNNPLKPEFIKSKKNYRSKKNIKLWRNESKINFRYGGNQKINLYMIMRNLMDIKYYILIRLKLDLFLTMNGKSLLNMMDIIDLNYGYQTDGILLRKIILINLCIGLMISINFV